jgi:prepilin-type N-terminal cleavage/methylation domain-containing protein
MVKKLARGFTLLEVMISIAILAFALLGIVSSQSLVIKMFSETKNTTIGTILAQNKIANLELEFKNKGFGEIPEEANGDFSIDGYPDYKWSYMFTKDPEIGKLGALMNASESETAKNIKSQASLIGISPQLIADTLDNNIRKLVVNVEWEHGVSKGQISLMTHFLSETITGIEEISQSEEQTQPSTSTPSPTPTPTPNPSPTGQ